MESFTLYPLSSHSVKKVSLVITLASLPLLIVSLWLDRTILFLTAGQVTELLVLITTVGLVGIAFSEEKVDDERVDKIRYTSYRVTLCLVLISLVSFASVDVAGTVPFTLDAGVLCLCILSLYITVFHIGLYSDTGTFYSNHTAGENFRHHRRLILLYLVPTTLLVLTGMGLLFFNL